MAAGLQALPPRLSHDLGLQVVVLLQLLEVATGVGFCHHCCNLRPRCRCVGVPQLTPPMLWSQFMEQTPGYGAIPSSSGVTTPSTSWGGMSGYMPPLPGMSIWNMPPLEDTIPPEPATIPPYWPPTRETGQLRSMMSVRGIVPQTPQMPTPIHQPPLLSQSQLATPYQQTVQLPSKTMGLGVTFDSSVKKPAPTDSQDMTYMEDRLPKAEAMAVSLPVIPGEDGRCPPSGRPTSQCLTRRVDTQEGRPIMSLPPPPQELGGLPPKTLWRTSLTIGALGGGRT